MTHTLDHILDAPADAGRYWLIVKSESGLIGTITLALQGDETESAAIGHFQDALAVLRQGLALNGGWMPCPNHIDGMPRTELELAQDAFRRKGAEIGYENITTTPEYERMAALMAA